MMQMVNVSRCRENGSNQKIIHAKRPPGSRGEDKSKVSEQRVRTRTEKLSICTQKHPEDRCNPIRKDEGEKRKFVSKSEQRKMDLHRGSGVRGRRQPE